MNYIIVMPMIMKEDDNNVLVVYGMVSTRARQTILKYVLAISETDEAAERESWRTEWQRLSRNEEI